MCCRLVILWIALFVCSPLFAAAPGLVGEWTFDEGQGDIARDSSGQDNHARLHGPRYVRAGKGFALKFDGVKDYAVCEDSASLGITGPITLMAWVHPSVVPGGEAGIIGKHTETLGLTFYKNGSAYFYVSSGGNNVNTPLTVGEWQHVVCTFDGAQMTLYINAVSKDSKVSQFKEVKRGLNFLMGCFVPDPKATDPGNPSLAHYAGLLDNVRVFNRCLNVEEIASYYKSEAGERAIDTSAFDKVIVRPFPYWDRRRVIVDADLGGFFALPKGMTLRIELRHAGAEGAPLAAQEVTQLPANNRARDLELKLPTEIPHGDYEVRAVLSDAQGVKSSEFVKITYAPDENRLASPAERAAAPLPAPVVPPEYAVEVCKGGGFKVSFGGAVYPVESSYSFPQGGANLLTTAAAPNKTGEPGWKVRVEAAAGDQPHRVTAEGRFYRIERAIHVTPSHILVKDTFTNTTGEVQGIMFCNQVGGKAHAGSRAVNVGNPSLFLQGKDRGIGLIALDDVYMTHRRARIEDGLIGWGDDNFALDAGASCTIEWAVYPTATSDPFDFITQARSDLGLQRRVEGSFTFVSRDSLITPEEKALKNLKYVSLPCLGHPLDDPSVSLEGIEYMAYPKESERIRKLFAQYRERYPDLKLMFHIAHGLYATDKPNDLFPDSRVIKADGKQLMYGGDTPDYYRRYFSAERVQQGWRWFIFYPTPDNTFGAALLKATDAIMDDLHGSGFFGDGFICGYGEGYTWDRWDGRSALIDPKTKTVTAKIGHVTLLSMPTLEAVVRKLQARGAVMVTNDWACPRTLALDNVLNTCESEGAMQSLYLSPTVTSLGASGRIKDDRDLYEDVLTKLALGGLYFFYGSAQFPTHDTLVQHMFPITVRGIHAGIITGDDRIITMRSGVYGWPGDRALHIVHKYDARGWPVASDALTTADASGVRTELALQPNESAVIVKLPVTVESPTPVNARVLRRDPKGIQLLLNGSGAVTFRHARGATGSVTLNGLETIEIGGE